MMRLLRPQPKLDVRVPDIATERHTIQRGTINDPFDQEGRVYLNTAHTAYLYVGADDELYYVAPASAAVKIS